MKQVPGTRAPSCQPDPRASAIRTRALVFAAIALVGLGTASCLGSAGGRTLDRDTTRISEDELGRITASNAYEAVAQLRPLWLQSRGRRSTRALPTEIVVAQNGSYFGPVTSLRLFPVEDIRELHHMDGSQASAYLSGLGSRHVEAAIVVVLR